MNDQARPLPSAASSGRRLRWALAVSLALNLAVGGVVLGAWERHHGMRPGGDLLRELRFGMFTDAMEPEQRAAFVAEVPYMRQARRDMRQEREGLLVALRAEPFDPARLVELLAAQSKRVAERMALGQMLLRDFVTGLDPAARLAFAGRLEARMAARADARNDSAKP